MALRLGGVISLALTAMFSGCTASTEYMVHYRSVPPFHPDDPNELLAELTEELPAGIVIRYFLHQQKQSEMRGIVLVTGGPAGTVVCDAVRRNPRLSLAGPGSEEVHAAGQSLVCLSSRQPFVPADEEELLAELQRGLPPEIKPRILASRRAADSILLWIVVKGNFGKEAVKFALRQNPNLSLLQVEDAPLFPRLSFWLAAHLGGKETKWRLYD
jgi:hypothetical protein